jgi:hypothetical protein
MQGGLWRRVATLAPDILSGLFILGGTLGWLIADRKLWFFGDDWEFMADRSLTHNTLDSLFKPHNEHWSTIPVLIYRLNYSLFGANHFLPYLLPMLAAHVGCCVLLWWLLRRAGAGPWMTMAGVAVASINGGGGENLSWSFQIGFVGSVFFGLLALRFIDDETLTTRRTVYGAIALTLGMMCSGMGSPMLVVAALYCFIRFGLRNAAKLVAAPVLAQVIWFLAYGHNADTAAPPHPEPPITIGDYIWRGVTNLWFVNSGIETAGALILVVVVGATIISREWDPFRVLAISGLAGFAAVYALTAVGRAKFGIDQATASRYVYVATLLVIPAGVYLLHRLDQLAQANASRVPAYVCGTLVLLLVVLHSINTARVFYEGRKQTVDESRDRILQAVQLVRSGERVFESQPSPTLSPNVTTNFIKANLSRLPVVNFAQDQLLQVRLATQVTLSDTKIEGIPAPVEVREDETPIDLQAGCTKVAIGPSQHLEIDAGAEGAQIQLTAPGKHIAIVLELHGQSTPQDVHPWSSQKPAWLATTISGATLRVNTDIPGKYTLCTQ